MKGKTQAPLTIDSHIAAVKRAMHDFRKSPETLPRLMQAIDSMTRFHDAQAVSAAEHRQMQIQFFLIKT